MRMKLHWSPRSPFVRKVMIVAHELGLADRLDCVRTVAATTQPHETLMKDNPLSKLPTLVLADGTVIYDSPVICEYFDSLHDGPKLFPATMPERLTVLRWQALGDGMLDFLLLWRNELTRPAQSEPHLNSYRIKRGKTLESLEAEAATLERMPYSVGHIAVGVALSYIDFRFEGDPWRQQHPKLASWHKAIAARPSFKLTEAVDDS
ncbi:glutathione S-transferase family protein [Rhodoplanes sp. Z2-YC6860]|uniref:glutathione S-transferase family protein n=1 Tax=Rhodoplanes sp. Z2-YC6860 TaxID=674703 RepID=UPI00078C1E0B|nr:glutathione S-transferase [Rhodoplanes sp. Z2-YC6860]AMN40637.1 glutathione S-transferase domain-containing protein [Rhodoplanes sp. Z2-YC6860]